MWVLAAIFTISNSCCSKISDSKDEFDQYATLPIYDDRSLPV
jgi:hypothetical protein